MVIMSIDDCTKDLEPRSMFLVKLSGKGSKFVLKSSKENGSWFLGRECANIHGGTHYQDVLLTKVMGCAVLSVFSCGCYLALIGSRKTRSCIGSMMQDNVFGIIITPPLQIPLYE